MRVEDVVDQESLQAYLEGLPDETRRTAAMNLAFRSAARSAPIALEFFAGNRPVGKSNYTVLSIFCGVMISAVASVSSTKMAVEQGAVIEAADAAVAGAVAAVNVADDFAAESAAASNAAADAAVFFSAISNSDLINAVVRTISFSADAVGNSYWALVRDDLFRSSTAESSALWVDGDMPEWVKRSWEETCLELENDSFGTDWAFWITWYERVLAGKDIYPEMLVSILNGITKEDWLGDPDAVNDRFKDVLAAYQKDDAALGGSSDPHATTTLHVKAIRLQVSTLKEFLEAEYLKLSGHNARNPEQDDMLDLLRELKGLVDDMLARFEDAESDENAAAVVSENLPAVVEKTGELALIESDPVISPTLATMETTIKTLVEAGGDPKLVTQFALSEAAGRKIWPKIKGMFPWGNKSGGPS